MSGMEFCSSVMKLCTSALTVPLLLIIITGSVSAVPVVKVKHGGTAVLNCTLKCSGGVSWTLTHKSTDILAECNQTSCRSVKEGYQGYLQGNLSLNITEADFSKRGNYTCKCDGKAICDVYLQIEALKTSVQIKPGGSLVMKLDVSDPVQVIYNSTGSADGSSVQICTVDGGSLQCKPEYTNRTSLAVELRDIKLSDSGIYIIRTIGNKENIHIYNVTVTEPDSERAGDLLWILIIPAVLFLVLLVGIVLWWRIIKQLKTELERVVLNQFRAVTEETSPQTISPLLTTRTSPRLYLSLYYSLSLSLLLSLSLTITLFLSIYYSLSLSTTHSFSLSISLSLSVLLCFFLLLSLSLSITLYQSPVTVTSLGRLGDAPPQSKTRKKFPAH